MVIFFNDTATTEIYTLSLHDALPIWAAAGGPAPDRPRRPAVPGGLHRPVHRRRPAHRRLPRRGDRKSPRLNSSHAHISYAVFSLQNTQHPISSLLPTVLAVLHLLSPE